MASRDIVAIGGSLGRTTVLRRILSQLPPNLPGSLLIATHVPSTSAGDLSAALNRTGPLPVSQAIEGRPIKPGHVCVAVPNPHQLVSSGAILPGTGPLRSRCQIGHAFTAETVITAQEEGREKALRLAMRMMEERTGLGRPHGP